MSFSGYTHVISRNDGTEIYVHVSELDKQTDNYSIYFLKGIATEKIVFNVAKNGTEAGIIPELAEFIEKI